MGNFSGHGSSDLAAAGRVGGVTLLFALPDGGIEVRPTLPVDPVGAFAAGDLNGDGFTDLVVAGTDPLELRVLLVGDGGSFTDAGAYPLGISPAEAIAVGDFNGDGKLDVIVVGGWSDIPITDDSPTREFTRAAGELDTGSGTGGSPGASSGTG